MGERLLDRLDDVKRDFPLALDLGCHGGLLATLLGNRGGVKRLISADLSVAMVSRAPPPRLVADEEALPVAAGSLDLVISSLGLHWVNDLPGALIQIRRALKPDGLLLAAMFGGATLRELRDSLTEAEIAEEGGLSPRVSPFADVRDVGDLLLRAGFALPVADSETLTVSYGDPLRLLSDLRGMGETNATTERRKTFSRRGTMMRAMATYRDQYGDGEGRVPATFEVIYLTAWAPHAAQQQPLRPGSARSSLAAALGGEEVPAGETVPRR